MVGDCACSESAAWVADPQRGPRKPSCAPPPTPRRTSKCWVQRPVQRGAEEQIGEQAEYGHARARHCVHAQQKGRVRPGPGRRARSRAHPRRSCRQLCGGGSFTRAPSPPPASTPLKVPACGLSTGALALLRRQGLPRGGAGGSRPLRSRTASARLREVPMPQRDALSALPRSTLTSISASSRALLCIIQRSTDSRDGGAGCGEPDWAELM